MMCMAHKDCRWEVNEIDFATGGVASLTHYSTRPGKPEAYRYVLRQSRFAGVMSNQGRRGDPLWLLWLCHSTLRKGSAFPFTSLLINEAMPQAFGGAASSF